MSDGTLRMAIANLMGWQIDQSYYRDRGKPWGAHYHSDRCRELEERVAKIADLATG